MKQFLSFIYRITHPLNIHGDNSFCVNVERFEGGSNWSRHPFIVITVKTTFLFWTRERKFQTNFNSYVNEYSRIWRTVPNLNIIDDRKLCRQLTHWVNYDLYKD